MAFILIYSGRQKTSKQKRIYNNSNAIKRSIISLTGSRTDGKQSLKLADPLEGNRYFDTN
jgi:hypothetical protein